MDAIVSDEAIVSRWGDYRSAYESAFAAYRDAYLQVYEKIRMMTEEAVAAIKACSAYGAAPSAERDSVLDAVFGQGKLCHYPPLALSTVGALLDAAAKRSLSSLEQALVALPVYKSQVEAELRSLASPPQQGERVYEWHPVRVLAGQRFTTEKEVDQALDIVSIELKTQIREGFTVVVK